MLVKLLETTYESYITLFFSKTFHKPEISGSLS